MIYSIRKRFVIAQLIVFVISWIYANTIDATPQPIFILLYSIWNTLSYIWLFLMELRYAPDFHPFQILALVCIQFIGLNGFELYNRLVTGERLDFCGSSVNEVLHFGFLFLALQHLILFAVFFYMEYKQKGKNKIQSSIADQIICTDIHYFKWSIQTYCFIWILRIIDLAVPLASISSILVNLTNYGQLLALFLLTFEMMRHRNSSAKTLHWLIVGVEILLVLNHGMKEEIIRNLIPYCTYMLIMYKAGYQRINARMFTGIALMGVFVVYFVFPYVSIFRSISISKGVSWSEISVSEAFAEYGNYMSNKGMFAQDEEDRGVGYMMSRAGAIGCNAWSISYAMDNGSEPRFFYYSVASMIPRAIWPSKPRVVSGAMVYNLASGQGSLMDTNSASNIHNSVSMGFIGSCYFCLGLWGAIVLIAFVALYLWYVWHYCKGRMSYNIVAIWTLITLLFSILKDFEGFGDCGVSFIVFTGAYILSMRYIFKGRKSNLT